MAISFRVKARGAVGECRLRPLAVPFLVLLLATAEACAKSGDSSGGSGGGLGASSGGAGAGGSPGTGGNTNGSGGDQGTASGGSAADAGKPGIPDASSSPGPDGGCVPNYKCTPTAPNTGDIYADCAARVNQFRACVCLPPLPRWNDGEACADQDAQYDSQQNVAHAGFQARICTSGNAQDECPNWKSATQVISQCLQQMFNEGPPPTTPCTGSCYSTYGHYINMTGTSYKSGVACGFYTTSSGSMWAAQNFK